jgi:large conductance mechanosensitive channel
MRGFRNFLMRGNLVDLAVAVVIGVAFNAVVQAFIADVITPLIAAVARKPTFAALSVHVGHGVISYGSFFNAMMSFLVTAAVVYYFLVAPTTRITTYANQRKAATERECPECLSQIPVAARRCMYCTSEVEPAPQPARNSNSGAPALTKGLRRLF